MKKIIINEKKIRTLLQTCLTEETVYLGDKKDLVINWLNKHFMPLNIQVPDELSLPHNSKVLAIKDGNGQVTEQLKSINDVFYILQTNFKKILSDKKERDKFLWETLVQWCN